MTKTQLAERLLSYPPDARFDVRWSKDSAISNMAIGELQEIVREWGKFTEHQPVGTLTGEQYEQAAKDAMPVGLSYYIGPYQGAVSRIPEPDPNTPPDYNS